MNYSNPPVQSTITMKDNIENPEPTFFFERSNGEIFAVNELGAWNIYSGKQQVLGLRQQKPKLIGTSDGVITYRAIEEAQRAFKTEGVEKAQEIIKKGQADELEEAMKHPRVPRNFDTMDNMGRPVRIGDLR